MMGRSIAVLLLLGAMVRLTAPGPSPAAEPAPVKVDVCVYGGTAAGVIAAVKTAQLGKSVVLIEPSKHLGGMTSGGLGWTDFGNKGAIGGMSRDFYRRLGKHYGKEEAWTFEPHVAEQVLKDLIAENKVRVLYEHRLGTVEKKGARITKLILDHAPPDEDGAPRAKPQAVGAVVVEALMFMDCTYEGDLLAKAKVGYHVGREAVAQYNESLNGIRANTPKHQFLVKVDPFVKPGDPASGLLPLIQPGDGGKPGDGDASVQAYNFRMCLTKKESNKLPIRAPVAYDPKRYELLARNLEALVADGKQPTLRMLLKIDMVTPEKTDINNQGAVSTDHIGANYDYPNGDWETRNRIWKDHIHYMRGLFYFLSSSARVPEGVQKEMLAWGLCKDEFQDTQGWPHQLYVREARRMVGRYVVTQNDCEHKTTIEDSVGLGAYNMDSHNCQRLVKNGAAINEGDVQVGPKGPYAIPYRAITPKAEECENLLVPVCLSSSHIAYGSARMEPVFMVLGESAALAANQAIDAKQSVQEIDYPKLRQALEAAKQVLVFKR
ncbi:MAG: FAD-dependent oxidoreductase [Planctomycetia bacterium]|nr:FAD-dependent oxidoreductase [Planctomycetia bacterium]